jgi:hypothetical protein
MIRATPPGRGGCDLCRETELAIQTSMDLGYSYTRRARRLTALVLLACFAATGCYSYSTMSMSDVSVGTEVRARVKSAEADSVAKIMGYRSSTIEGKAMSPVGAQGLLLAVPSQAPTQTGEVRQLYQRLLLPPSTILEIEQRKLDKVKTGAVVAAVVLVAGFIAVKSFGGTGVPSSSGSKGGTNAMVVPIR